MSEFLYSLLFDFTVKFIVILGYSLGVFIDHSFIGVFNEEHVVLIEFIPRIRFCLVLDYTFYEFIHFIKVTPNPFIITTFYPPKPSNIMA